MDARLPWSWLAAFGILQGLNQWSHLLDPMLKSSLFVSHIRIIAGCAAFACLIEFGRLSTIKLTGRGPGRWIYAPLLLLTALGSFAGWDGLNAASRYVLCLTGGLWSAVVLRALSKKSKDMVARALSIASLTIGLYAALSAVAVPTALFFPANILNYDNISSLLNFPYISLKGIASLALGTSIWAYWRFEKALESRQYAESQYGALTTAAIIFILVCGWQFANIVSGFTEKEHRSALMSRVATAAISIDSKDVEKLSATTADFAVMSPYSRLRSYLQAILRNDEFTEQDARFAYLLTTKNGQVVFLVDAEPQYSKDFSPPGQVYSEASKKLRNVFIDGKPVVEGPYKDRWGEWVSGFAPIIDHRTNRVVAVLGLDIHAREWSNGIAVHRMFCILITLFACTTVLLFSFILQDVKDNAVRVAVSEAKHRSVIDGTPNVVSFLNTDGSIISINRAGIVGLGKSEEELIGTHFSDLWPHAAQPIANNALAMVAEGERCSFDAEYLHPDGQSICYYVVLSPVFNCDGSTTGIAVIWTDITESRRTEQKTKEHLDFLQTIIDAIPVPVFYKDLNGVYLGCNNAYAIHLGVTKSDIIGNTISDLLDQETAHIQIDMDKKLMANPGTMSYESDSLILDGKRRYAIVYKSTFNDANGETTGIIGSLLDITTRKRAEEALAMERERLAVTLQSIGDGVIVTDTYGNVTLINNVAASLMGRSADEVIEKPIEEVFNIVNEVTGERALNPVRLTLKTVRCLELEDNTALISTDGTQRSIADSCAPVLDANGKLMGAVLVFRDVTEQKEAEEIIRELNADLSATLQAIPDLLFELDRNGTYLRIWTQSPELLAQQEELLLGHTINQVLSPEAAQIAMESIREADKNGISQGKIMRIDFPDGPRWFELSTSKKSDSDVDNGRFITLSRDITERKQAEHALLESERRVRRKLDAIMSPDGDISELELSDIIDAEKIQNLMEKLHRITNINAAIMDISGNVLLETGWQDICSVFHQAHPKSGCMCSEHFIELSKSIDPGTFKLFRRNNFMWDMATPIMLGDRQVGNVFLGQFMFDDETPDQEVFRKHARELGFDEEEFLAALDLVPRCNRDTVNATMCFYAALAEMISNLSYSNLKIASTLEERSRIEQALRDSEAKARAVMTAVGDALIIIDDYGDITYWNPAAEGIFGYSSDEVVGKKLHSLVAPEHLIPIQENAFERFKTTGQGNAIGKTVELPAIRKDGTEFPVELMLSAFSVNDRWYATGIIRDITERKNAEKHLRIQSSAMNAATDMILITRIDGTIEFVNSAFEKETGYSFAEAVGGTPRVLKSGKHDNEYYDNIWKTVTSGKSWSGEMVNRRKDGSEYIEEMTITPVMNKEGVVEHFIAIKRNITEKKEYEEQLDYMAYHDPLTGLPNRLLFSDRLAMRLAQARRTEQSVVVMFLDIDKFKLINDTLGHKAGDLLLKGMAERLQSCVREADTIARMGGDEFTIILSDENASVETAIRVAERILQSVAFPFDLDDRELYITTSIGISIYPTDGDDGETLVKNADTAMYRAKEKGRNNWVLYKEAFNTADVERMTLENSLQRALERDEMLLHYQPQVNIKTGETLGCEVLVRWQHPEYGLVSPGKFIPIAEENGLIVPLSKWVLKTACAQNKAWQDAGHKPINIAVNISAKLFQKEDLVKTVSEVLSETGLDPSYLELELTETGLMQKPELAVDVLNQLKEMGVKIAIDDFGTGYSSLSYLKRFPINAVKIDQSFVRDITTNSDDATIAGAVVAMAHSLNLKVIAEGVETLEQLKFLRSLKCDEIQGYFISRPVPAEDFVQHLIESGDSSGIAFRPAA